MGRSDYDFWWQFLGYVAKLHGFAGDKYRARALAIRKASEIRALLEDMGFVPIPARSLTAPAILRNAKTAGEIIIYPDARYQPLNGALWNLVVEASLSIARLKRCLPAEAFFYLYPEYTLTPIKID